MIASPVTQNGLRFAVCQCCGLGGIGVTLHLIRGGSMDPDVVIRCERHKARNPCVVEGCKRTRRANGGIWNDFVICGEHFRRFVPPGSAERRSLNRLARLAKKAGYTRNQVWPDDLEQRWWRLWRGVMRRIRRQSAEGPLDVAEINKLFGWEDAA